MDKNEFSSGVSMIKLDGAKVRMIRESKGLTQLYLATAVGVTTDTISRWENRRYPTIKRDNGLKLAEALETNIEDILEQTCEEQPALIASDAPLENESKVLSPKKSSLAGYWFLAALFGVSVAVALFYFWFSSPTPSLDQHIITAHRLLPRHAAPGQPFPVAVTIFSEPETPLSLILKEKIPDNAVLLSSVPFYASHDQATKVVKWLKKINSTQIFTYMVRLDPLSSKESAFSGSVAIRQGLNRKLIVQGNARVEQSPFHWADSNRDGRIDDEEILMVYDTFSEVEGLELDIDSIEEIWLGDGYIWDEQEGQDFKNLAACAARSTQKGII